MLDAIAIRLDSAHHKIRLHPAHLQPGCHVSLRLDVTYATSAMHVVVREMELDDFRCGRFVDLYKDGPRRFRYFDADPRHADPRRARQQPVRHDVRVPLRLRPPEQARQRERAASGAAS